MRVAASEQAAARRFQFAMIAGKATEGLLELRYARGRGMAQEFFEIARISEAADRAGELGQLTDVYPGAVPRLRPAGTADACGPGWALWADLDSPESVAELRAFRPRPTLVITSGSRTADVAHLHAWWALNEPLDGNAIVASNQRLARALGADPAATDRARVMRAAGTSNRKGGRRSPVSCVYATTAVHGAQDIVGDLPELASPPMAAAQPMRAMRGGRDPLLSIPATEYLPALTGRHLGSNHKMACPFHDDRTPSLHVYPGDRGWTCFGCGRGGSIIDLAAELYDLEPRGAGFHEIRRRLAAELLERAA